MTIKEIEKELKENDSVMLYFSGEHCSVCTALMPKIKNAFAKDLPKIKQIYISVEEYPQTAAHYGVFSIPSILVYFESKEFAKKSRLISVDGLVQDLTRPYNLFFT